MVDPEQRVRRFESPDGRSWLVIRQTWSNGSARPQEMDAIAYRDGESVTYEQRGSSWVAISGYRNGRIFYRKSNLACGGTRWHHIELEYPRELKRRLDDAVSTLARGMTAYGNACGP
jgi:hypothetical protein